MEKNGISFSLPKDNLDDLMKFYQAADYVALETKSRQHLKNSPDLPVLYLFLGIALAGLHKFADAIDAYGRAIALQPDYAEAYTNLGSALRSYGKIEEAITEHKKAITLNPEFGIAWYNLGIALQEMGHPEDAFTAYERASELTPDYPGTYYNVHALMIDRGNLTGAINCLDKAVKLSPDTVKYKFYLGVLLDYSGKTDLAQSYFDVVERDGNDNDQAWLDSWRYIRNAQDHRPVMFGASRNGFQIGVDAAPKDGLVLEFGVRHGTSIRMLSKLLGAPEMHGFDSFEGLPEAWHHEPAGSYSTHSALPQVPDNIKLHTGWFEKTLPDFVARNPGPVRLMNIDCDIYSSTVTILELLAKQIIPGTIIVFDEYIGNRHWRQDEYKAFQEAVAAQGWRYEYLAFSMFTKQVIVRIL